MSHILPFKGWRYNLEKVEDMAKVISPPYDVISAVERKRLNAESPYNIVHLILGGVDSGEGKYSQAASLFNRWCEEQVLKKDETPSIYILAHSFNCPEQEKRMTRWGFFALMRLDDPENARIFPHEDIFSKPKEDRLKLLREFKANLSPIFGIFQDEEKRIGGILKDFAKANSPLLDFSNFSESYRLWNVSDKKFLEAISKNFKKRPVFIADGHHRYEAAKLFCNNYNYAMFYLSALNEEGLAVLPTHRMMKVPEDVLENLEQRLEGAFEVQRLFSKEEISQKLKQAKQGETLIGVYSREGIYLLRLKDESFKGKVDTVVLHSLILKKLFSIVEKGTEFTHSLHAAIEAVDAGDFNIAFLLNPSSISQLQEMASRKEYFPQKSTYFYPKVPTGLVINRFDG